jgi:zinc protease
MTVPTRAAGALLIALALSACGTARVATSAARDSAMPRRHVLPNGVSVVVLEHRSADVAAVQLWVRAGARDETASELGLAHYLEHMLFKGTPTRTAGFVDREIERVGGRINAGTSLDYTFYHAVLPASRAAATVRLLADIAVNATLDETLLDNEKRIVLEEMRLHEDNPRRFLMRRLLGLAFDGHPYGRPIIGRPELIRALERETLLAFYRRHYVPEAFTLVVVGAVNPAEIVATATDAFSRVPRRGERRRTPASPASPPARSEQIERPGAHGHLGLAWLAPRLDHADTPAMSVLVTILGQSRTARLRTALRDRLGIVHAIGSSYTAMEAAGVTTITAEFDPQNLARVESEIVAEVRRVRDRGVTEDERRRAITAAEAAHEFSLETAEGRAYALGRAETIWTLEDELAWVDRLRSVDRGQITAVARRYLDPSRYVRLSVMPKTQ